MPLIPSTPTQPHEAGTVFGRWWFLSRYPVRDKWTPVQDGPGCSALPPCGFTVLSTPVRDFTVLGTKRNTCRRFQPWLPHKLTGFHSYAHAPFRYSQSKGHWPKCYILPSQKKKIDISWICALPRKKTRDLIQKPSQSKPGVYRRLLYYKLGRGVTRTMVTIDRLI